MAQVHDSEELRRLREVIRGKRRRRVSGDAEVIPFEREPVVARGERMVPTAEKLPPPPQFMPEQCRTALPVVRLQLETVIRLGLPQIEAHRFELEKILALVRKQSDNSSKAIPMLEEQINLVSTYTSAIRQCGI